MISITHYASPVGKILLAERDGALCGLWIDGQEIGYLGILYEGLQEKETPCLRQAAAWLNDYFAGKRPSIAALQLAPFGSDFQQAVWQILREIPYGQTTTYGEIARQMAQCTGKQKMSAQAVGGAVGRNPVSIIIPCHRVVGANGSLTGYAGGIAIKSRLLAHEGVDMSRLFVPKKGTAL